jgi:FMN phosphatase YigB (HAD superfamily)
MLETLSLDAGGVLVRPHWPRIADIFVSHGIRTTHAALSAVELKVMRDIDCEAQINETRDDDRLSVFFSQILDFAGAVGTRQARQKALTEVRRIHAEENLWEHVPDDVIPALDRFKALGLNLIVLSNANGTVRKRFERLGMSRWFSHIVDSGEEAVEKPDPRFFSLGLERAGANRESTISWVRAQPAFARPSSIAAVCNTTASVHGSRISVNSQRPLSTASSTKHGRNSSAAAVA